jgi:hypothetical protein
MPWVHDPGVFATAGVLGWLGILTLALAAAPSLGRTSDSPFTLGSLLLVITAAVLLAIGAGELALLPAGAALSLSIARLTRPWIAALFVVIALSPSVVVVTRPFLRESLFHGIYPRAVPLAAYACAVTLPCALAYVVLAGRAVAARRLISVAVGVVCVAASALILVFAQPACTAERYGAVGLSCELESAAQRTPM